ncbi:MAG: BadF/BadG/BcrA/BcrD ATPase family protein [Verrucomicrobiota bacterium]
MIYRIGIDGGGTKTECVLLDESGNVVARHLAPGCNPSVAGPEQARLVVTDALCQLVAALNLPAGEAPTIAHTHIYAAGNRTFWRETGATLTGFGRVFTADDSWPVLELATHGQPGLVLHGGTGSFVAARAPDGSVHYAGGIGWRFGDPGSGYDLGRRAIGRALLELQGWAIPSRLGPTVRDHTQLGETADAAAITRFFYYHAEPNRQIAGLAPAILRLAAEGDHTAHLLMVESLEELLALARRVATKLFPEVALDTLPAGLSGPILTHPVALTALSTRSPLPLTPVEGAPIDGVRRLVMRA